MGRNKAKFSKQQIELAIQKIKEGTESELTVPGLVDAAKKTISKRAYEARNTTRTIHGVVKRRTEKAVLFSQKNTCGEEVICGEIWWPLSQVTIYDRAMGPLDSMVVPEWLWAKKLETAK